MNRILFKEQHERYEMSKKDPRFEHVRGVLRMKVGDSFDVGVVNGPRGKAVIKSLIDDQLICEVVWGEKEDSLTNIHLWIGLPRPQTAKKILFDASVLGMKTVHFVPCGKSDPNYSKSSLWKQNEWEAVLIAGAEQAFQTNIPECHLHESFEDGLEAVRHMPTKLALDVYEGTTSLSEIRPLALPLVVAVGPEGGWVNNERKQLKEEGFQIVSMGLRVLRCEMAVTAAISILYHRLGLWT